MESLLFDMLMTGFILLTLALGFGFFTIDNFFAQHLAHKTAFSIVSWLVYGALLIGHWKFGWRGQQFVYPAWVWPAGARFYRLQICAGNAVKQIN